MLSDSKEQSQYVGSKKHHDILLILNDNDKSRFFAPVPVVDAQAGLQRYCWYVQKCFVFFQSCSSALQTTSSVRNIFV